jgi:hypothetical protein
MAYAVFGKDDFDNVKFTFIYNVSDYEKACKVLNLDELALIYCEPVANTGLDNITVTLFLDSIKKQKRYSVSIGDIIHSYLSKYIDQYE